MSPRQLPSLCMPLLALLALLVPQPLWAGTSAPVDPDTYNVEIRLVAAQHIRGGDKPGPDEPLDQLLLDLQKDLKDLPFRQFKLADRAQKVMRNGESVTMQFGRPEKRRFVRVTARGNQGGKVMLDVVAERATRSKPRQEFKSTVSIPPKKTLVVVTSRKGDPSDAVLLLAISAVVEPPLAATGSTGAAPLSGAVPPAASATGVSAPPP